MDRAFLWKREVYSDKWFMLFLARVRLPNHVREVTPHDTNVITNFRSVQSFLSRSRFLRKIHKITSLPSSDIEGGGKARRIKLPEDQISRNALYKGIQAMTS